MTLCYLIYHFGNLVFSLHVILGLTLILLQTWIMSLVKTVFQRRNVQII